MRMNIKIDADIHKRLRIKAFDKGTSLQSFVDDILKRSLQRKNYDVGY